MYRRRVRPSCEGGQAAIALVAVVPVFVVIVLGLLQLALAGHAALSAAAAARAAARADYVGADPRRAARRALPEVYRPGLDVATGSGRVEVELRAPRALPGLPRIPVGAASRLGPSEGVSGG